VANEFNIRILKKAHQDIQNISKWYDLMEAGLGQIVKQKVRDSINKLAEFPFFQIRYNDVYCKPLRNFPVTIHYKINEIKRIVSIVAVFHDREDSVKWFRK